MSLNRIVLLGYVAQTPELRYTQDGQPVTRLILHVEPPEGGEPDRIRVIARRELAVAIVDVLQRGDLAIAEGRVLMRTYLSAKGTRHKVAEVEADRLAKVPGASVPEPAAGT